MQNDNTINWFGSPVKRKTKHKSNSRKKNNTLPTQVSYLGFDTKQKFPKVNFLGINTKNKQYKMAPSSLFKKESIRKKKLSKWGDADMDGSPNYFDCDPTNFLKDAKKLTGSEEQKMLYEVKGKMKEDKRKNSVFRSVAKDFTRGFKTFEKPYKPLKEEHEKRKDVKIKLGKERQDAIREYKKLISNTTDKKEIKQIEDNYREHIKEINEEEKQHEKSGERLKELKEKTAGHVELLQRPGIGGRIDRAQAVVDAAHAAGKEPSTKQAAELAAAQKRARLVGDIQSEGKLSREILTKIPLGQVGRVLSGAAVTKSGEYSNELKAKSNRVRRMTNFATGAIFGNLTHGAYASSEPRGRGRPPGPSGEYKIGGRPVYEGEFQQYASKQAALNRMSPSEQQSATLNPEYVAYMKAQKAAERGETQTVMTEDGMPMEGIPQANQNEGYPSMGSSMMQTGQQQVEMQQKRAYNRATPDEIKTAQYQAQAADNPLMAPNFMRGELKATGGSLLTPIGPSILEAPQVFKGEMRNVTQQDPNQGEVKLGERPQTNAQGSEFLEIEIGSGKPVIRRRISEKWMDGRAL